MQNEKPPLNNVKVRRAIAMSIDKQQLTKSVYSGHAEPAKTMVPPTIAAHHSELEDYPYDVPSAKSLLEEAAREEGFSLPLHLSMFVMQQPRPYMQQPRQTALFIRDSLEKIGIELEITTIDLRQYWERLSRGEHELALAGWTSDNNDPDNFLYSLLDSDSINDQGGNNFSRYDNPELHKLLMAGKTELDEAKRKQLYLEAQELIHADVPVVPLAHTQVRIAQRENVAGYKLHASALVRLRLAHLTDQEKSE
jgi:ABC-type transport system substrate-binding protein